MGQWTDCEFRGCSRCGEKDISKFDKHSGRRFGVQSLCRRCQRRASTICEWKRSGELIGWNEETYNQAMERQDGACAICGHRNLNNRKLARDHNHTTGRPRELLCIKCNAGLGSFRESIPLLLKAIDYLKKHESIDSCFDRKEEQSTPDFPEDCHAQEP